MSVNIAAGSTGSGASASCRANAQQASADRAAPLGCFKHQACQTSYSVGIVRTASDQFGVPGNRLQGVIEIVRDAACELSQGDHPLCVGRLGLGLFARGDLLLDLRFSQEMANEQECIPIEVDDDNAGIDCHQRGQAQIDG
jgi:hypothetical protein